MINSAAIDSDMVAVVDPGLDMIAVIDLERGVAETEGATGAVAAGRVVTD